MFRKLKNMEMSKRILYVLGYLIAVLLPLVVIVSLVTKDTSSLTQYVIGVFALASVAVGFYYWKAKNENLHKYAKTDSDSEKAYIDRLLRELKEDKEDGE